MPVPLTLALVGTTSSGKSTLANLIVGRLLLPINVQESPRVVVAIRNAPGSDGLLHGVDGSKFRARVDEELRQRLEEQIRAALSVGGTIQAEMAMALARPEGWLAVLQGRPRLPSLPRSALLTIRDLPGYLHSGDRAALQTIASHLDGALPVVLFNAEESDSRKEAELIRFVMEQKLQRGGAWSEALFVLNRADVFGRDMYRQGDREVRVAGLRQRCGEIAAEVFSLSQVPRVTVHSLAALPALAGQLLAGSRTLTPRDRRYLIEVAVRTAGSLLDEQELERLPRSPRSWRFWHTNRYARAVQQASGWASLRAVLCGRAAPPPIPAAASRQM